MQHSFFIPVDAIRHHLILHSGHNDSSIGIIHFGMHRCVVTSPPIVVKLEASMWCPSPGFVIRRCRARVLSCNFGMRSHKGHGRNSVGNIILYLENTRSCTLFRCHWIVGNGRCRRPHLAGQTGCHKPSVQRWRSACSLPSLPVPSVQSFSYHP